MKYKQSLIVYTKTKKMYVYEDLRLVRIIDNICLGKNGVATYEQKSEGDLKTPLGTYNLGLSFGIEDLNIKYPYIKIDENSYWVDDVKSEYYNYFLQLVSKINTYNYPYALNIKYKDFSRAEHLIDFKNEYKYCVFIEYNAPTLNRMAMPNKGSAIFLHCNNNKSHTSGCIAINENDMVWIMNFLNKDKNPCIIIK